MGRTTVIELLATKPFTPLTVTLNSGQQHTIHHPELAIVGSDFLMVALKPDDDDVPDRGCFLALSNITSIEPAVSKTAS